MLLLAFAVPALRAGARGPTLTARATISMVDEKSKSRQIAKFEAAQDYLFFQGPAPKSAIQEDLPSFFSPENFQYAVDNLKITPLRIGIGLAGLGAFTIIFLSLVLAPGSQSPFFFLDRFYPPAIAKKKVVDAEKARIKAEEDRKKAAAKAEAEAKAKAEAEAKAKA